MLKDILEFFRREKFYTVLFILLVGFFTFALIYKEKEKPKRSQKIEHYQQAEKRMQEKVKESGSLVEYLKGRPKLLWAIQIFWLLTVIAVSAGFILDSMLIFRPETRGRFGFDFGPPRVEWKVSMVFKVLIWFFIFNLLLAFVLEFFKRSFDWNQDFFMLLHTSIAHYICFGLIFWSVKSAGGSLRDIGFRKPKNIFKEIGYGWLGYLLILPFFVIVLVALIALTQIFHYEPPPHPLVNVFLEDETGARGLIFYSIFLATVVGPIFEEIFFRGFFYPAFRQRFGRLTAMVITSSFFAFIHDSTFAFWPIFILGMGLCYIYEKRFSLIPSITLHITHNLIFITYFFLAKDILSRELG